MLKDNQEVEQSIERVVETIVSSLNQISESLQKQIDIYFDLPRKYECKVKSYEEIFEAIRNIIYTKENAPEFLPSFIKIIMSIHSIEDRLLIDEYLSTYFTVIKKTSGASSSSFLLNYNGYGVTLQVKSFEKIRESDNFIK